MAHIYMSFDFGTDEEKAQLARHKLEMWKQAFRLDKKLLYKFERPGGEGSRSFWLPEELSRKEADGFRTAYAAAAPDRAKATRPNGCHEV